MIISTLEFQHPTLPGGALRYVKDGVDFYGAIETGEWVWFEAGQFAFQLPDKATKGQEALTVAAPNTNLTLAKSIDAAKRHEPIVPVISIYREYDPGDPSQPRNKRIRLTMSSAKIDTMTVTLTNTWKDLTNRRFMRRIYNTQTHPGLKYL